MNKILWIYLILINIVTFFVYGIDKRKARNRRWRIQESTLIWLAVFGGGVGAFMGMHVYHHKTKHAKFTVGIPIIIAVQVLIAIFLH